MLRAAQILSGLIAVFVGGVAIFYLVNPAGAGTANGMNPETVFGITNMRTLAAPLLMMSLMAAIGTVKQNWVFLLPSALYFIFTAIIRIFGIFLDGADPSTTRGLVLAIVLFVVAEVALQIFRKAERQSEKD